MTAARGVVLGALVLVVAVVAFVVLRGETGTKYRLIFENAGQLVKGGEVQVGGKRVGTVQDLELSDKKLAEVTIRVKGDVAPLHEGTSAVIRATSLSGAANRFIALTPGPNSNPELEDGAEIGTDHTQPIVDIDQLLNTLDDKTRKALQQFVAGNARWYEGKGKEANPATEYFNPAVGSTRRLITQALADQGTLTSFLQNTARAMRAIGARGSTVTDLVSNANETVAAIGSEEAALDQALRFLPDALRKGNTTFVNLRSTLDDLDVLVNASKPATKRLAPLFRELRPLVADARPVVRDLSVLVNKPGASNDVTDLLRTTPELSRVGGPALGQARKAIRQSVPNFAFSRPYGPELIAWLRDFGQGAANYDANGHYARVAPLFFSHKFVDTPQGGELRPQPPANKYDGLQKHQDLRCAGGATQTAADGSSPWADDGNTNPCDLRQVPPGP
jgi:phospholipid/cholesterol/gamma-HCH transport system substrate-binding protein